jgi:hypothetical protein
MKKKILAGLVTGLLMTTCIEVAQSALVSWTDWTNTSAVASAVSGTLTFGSNTVNVTYSGLYSFAQTNGSGNNYWNPSAPYLSSLVGNAPPGTDIIALNTGGTKTITFSQAVQDPILALVSWNSNTVDFGVPITILNSGPGYWGSGTPILNATGTGFFGSGEVHGIIELAGTYNSITFTDTSENWHGFTVGAVGLPSTSVPEPATMLLFGTGLAGVAGLRLRRKK